MENFIKEHDYAILVYAKEDTAKYTAAIKALTETKKGLEIRVRLRTYDGYRKHELVQLCRTSGKER